MESIRASISGCVRRWVAYLFRNIEFKLSVSKKTLLRLWVKQIYFSAGSCLKSKSRRSEAKTATDSDNDSFRSDNEEQICVRLRRLAIILSLKRPSYPMMNSWCGSKRTAGAEAKTCDRVGWFSKWRCGRCWRFICRSWQFPDSS